MDKQKNKQIIRHTDFLLWYINIFKPTSYLELGLYIGETFNKVCKVVPYCVGVDIINYNIEILNPHLFFNTTTDIFFTNNTRKYDIIFIDADHNFESVKKDLINSITVLEYNGTIFLHDTDPSESKYLLPGYCNDAYRIIEYIKKYCSELDIITFPIGHEGLSVVKRNNDRRIK